MIALTLLLCLASAFFTGIIGVHPIFGAFLAGLICPHEGGFAIKVAEKIEDLIGALFLPLYFTLSGLNTNIGLLDSGIIWGYVVAVIIVAFFSKFVGATIAARFTGMLWRECFAIGSLMSCKGLVELIVLVSCVDFLPPEHSLIFRHVTRCSQSRDGLSDTSLDTPFLAFFMLVCMSDKSRISD
jgi:Kef-type K+ transport system membrane component KefB